MKQWTEFWWIKNELKRWRNKREIFLFNMKKKKEKKRKNCKENEEGMNNKWILQNEENFRKVSEKLRMNKWQEIKISFQRKSDKKKSKKKKEK